MAESSQTPTSVARDDGLGVIGGAIVGNDDLDIRRGLGKRTLDGTPEKMGTVHGRDSNGQARWHSLMVVSLDYITRCSLRGCAIRTNTTNLISEKRYYQ